MVFILRMDFLDENGSLDEYGFFWMNMDSSGRIYMVFMMDVYSSG